MECPNGGSALLMGHHNGKSKMKYKEPKPQKSNQTKTATATKPVLLKFFIYHKGFREGSDCPNPFGLHTPVWSRVTRAVIFQCIFIIFM